MVRILCYCAFLFLSISFTPIQIKDLYYTSSLDRDSVICVTQPIDLMGATLSLPDNCTIYFQGGSFSNGTLSGNGISFVNAKGCLASDVLISGIPKDATVEVDWWNVKKISIQQYEARIDNLVSPNDTILRNILSNGEIKNIIFGEGIYYFNQSFIPGYLTSRGRHIFGKGPYATCLYFPLGEGFIFHRGDLISSEISDLFIFSRKECIKLDIDSPSERFNAMEHNRFSNLILVSDDGGFCFGASKDYNSFMYDNHFHKVGFLCKNDSTVFKNVAGLGTTFDMMEDQHRDFHAPFSSDFINQHGHGIIFEACRRVHITNSNIGFMGPKHLYAYFASADDEKQGICITAENCNFEGFTDSFIYTSNDYAGIDHIHFSECSFASSIPSNILPSYNHFRIFRASVIRGIPESIYNISDGSYYPTRIEGARFGDLLFTDGKLKNVAERIEVAPTKIEKGVVPAHAIQVEGDIFDYYFLSGKQNYVATNTLFLRNIQLDRCVINLADSTTLTRLSDIVTDDWEGRPLFITLSGAMSLRHEVDFGDLFCFRNPVYGNYSRIAPVTLHNDSDITVTVKSGGNESVLFPDSYQLMLGKMFISQPQRIERDSEITLIGVDVGQEYVISGRTYRCTNKGCGVYTSAGPRFSEWQLYLEENAFVPRLSVMSVNGYIYMLRNSGDFSGGKTKNYPTDTDITFADGTATLVCLGKSPTMVLTSGTTGEKPTNAPIGFCYFDTTLDLPLWKTANGWFAPSIQ